MKTLYFLFFIAIITFSSCERKPDSSFFSSEIEVRVHEDVYFTNTSLDAVYYKWDFDDGTYSRGVNPVHSWEMPGIYTVILASYSDSYVDRSYQDITVLPTTDLEIEVLEYYDKYPVANASVILYGSYQDWLDEKNKLIEGFTDVSGRVLFTNLDVKRYYVDVWEEHHNNYTLAEEDPGFIETDILVDGQINYFTAWVDYTGSLKSSTGRDRSRLIEKKGRKVSNRK
jgi:hypothetical protein